MPSCSDNMSETDKNASCPKCGKKNPATARFCGRCGAISSTATLSAVVIKSLKEEFLQIKIARHAEEVKHVEEARDVADKGIKINTERIGNISFGKRRNRVFSFVYCLPLPWRKKMAMALFVCLTGLVAILLNGMMLGNKHANVRWIDFRTFLARSFELTHSELDQIYNETFGGMPDSTVTISCDQATRIEHNLQKLFQKPDFSIFPNPFFSEQTVAVADYRSSGQRFSDIPISHPLYSSMQHLLELNISLADKKNRIRPYEPIAWSEWQEVVDQIFKLLGIDPPLPDSLSSQRHGSMSNIDLRNYIEHLREKLFIKSSKTLIWAGETIYPSRFETFAALSNMLREINNNR